MTGSPILLGVRHHGPGSARAVRRALDAYQPDIVLIEGPPEADALVALAGQDQMRPPVALLAYPTELTSRARTAKTAATTGGPVTAVATVAGPAAGAPDGSDAPDGSGQPGSGGPADDADPSDPDTRPGGEPASRAAFWPFAEFSPEWQALRWAVGRGVPVRFCDQPAAQQFATVGGDLGAERDERRNPIVELAEAAGYPRPEDWWEDVVEQRLDVSFAGDDELSRALAPFEAIAEAMAEVRAAANPRTGSHAAEEERREAHMRTALRAACREFERVAVVCGAWHVPALTAPLPPAAQDARILRGIPKAKVSLTWVPWTHGRLASWRGYGAGVTSPGWYHHLFTTEDHTVARWFVQVAAVLRDEGLPVSSAHVIEGVRMAETLAVVRGRPMPGLPEITESVRAVLCDGDDLRVELVDRRLVVGDRLGAVPDDTPAVPLLRDVAATQKRLRLPAEALARDLDLDLRKDIDRERSRLLHRLRLLGVDWGRPAPARRGSGTFWESWHLGWEPGFAVDLIEASAYGLTVAEAAGARVREKAARSTSLGEVTALVEQCLLADLPAALDDVLVALDARVALDTDVAHLLAALPPLARTVRYGDVRGTDLGALRSVTGGLVVRACVNLPGALAGLDDAAAREMRKHVDLAHTAIGLLAEAAQPGPSATSDGLIQTTSDGPATADGGRSGGAADGGDLRERWLGALDRAANRDDLPGLLTGRLTRLLFDAGRLDADEVGHRMALNLTVGVPPATAAAWVEGFLAGGGLLLVHDPRLLALVDGWLTAIPADVFVEILPLLRRTFSQFEAPERRSIGERARALESGTPVTAPQAEADLDPARVALVVPTVSALLGWAPVPDQEVTVR